MTKDLKFYIKVDTNDADYVTEVFSVSEEERKKIMDVFFKLTPLHWKWNLRDWDTTFLERCLNNDEIEFILEFTPYCSCGFHTVMDAYFYNESDVQKLCKT